MINCRIIRNFALKLPKLIAYLIFVNFAKLRMIRQLITYENFQDYSISVMLKWFILFLEGNLFLFKKSLENPAEANYDKRKTDE